MKMKIVTPRAMGLYESSVPSGTVGVVHREDPKGQYWVDFESPTAPKSRSGFTLRILQCHIDRGIVEILHEEA